MPSSFSPRLRETLQNPGENLNTWGNLLNTGALQLLEDAIAKRVALTLSGSHTLTSANGVSDEARCAFLDVTGGTGGTLTCPGVEKIYLVRNAASGNVVVTTGAGAIATIDPGEMVFVECDGANVARVQITDFQGATLTGITQINALTDPSVAQQAATKHYVDNLVSSTAFTMAAGSLPAQGSNPNSYLYTNGSTASWRVPVTSDLSDYATDQATRAAAIKAFAIGMAASL